jgi:hypothetical protein
VSAGTCAIHFTAPAVYRCDGCGRLLCEECVEVGHRLLFCHHCGERALPLDSMAPATSPDLRRRRVQEGPYTLGDALRYPFRGLGLHMLLGYLVIRGLPPLVTLFGFQGLGCIGIFAGIVAVIARIMFAIFIFLLLPGLLFEIVRTTAAGEDELPDWPDLSEIWTRVGEVLGMFVIGMACAIPTLMFMWAFGCSLEELIYGGAGRCLLAVVLGLPLGIALWVPVVGAVGTFQSWWLAPRLDLHLRALRMLGPAATKTAGLIAGTLILGKIVEAFAAGTEPLIGAALGDTISLYALFVGAHLVGVLFRRHARELEALYIGVVGDQSAPGGVRL